MLPIHAISVSVNIWQRPRGKSFNENANNLERDGFLNDLHYRCGQTKWKTNDSNFGFSIAMAAAEAYCMTVQYKALAQIV